MTHPNQQKSKALIKTERNYTVFEEDIFAIAPTSREFCHFLSSVDPFLLITHQKISSFYI